LATIGCRRLGGRSEQRSILGRLAKLWAVRLSDDPDPGLHQAIYAMHDRKAGMYPDWGHDVAVFFGAV
jgi:hypothetical protein